jgi:hypothetical protein
MHIKMNRANKSRDPPALHRRESGSPVSAREPPARPGCPGVHLYSSSFRHRWSPTSASPCKEK